MFESGEFPDGILDDDIAGLRPPEDPEDPWDFYAQPFPPDITDGSWPPCFTEDDCPPIYEDAQYHVDQDAVAGMPPYTPGRGAPCGVLARKLDRATADPTQLCDADLIDAVVAWDEVVSWASARQTRVLAEFGRRRPGDDPLAAMVDRPSSLSTYAPDEIGLALRCSRGAAVTRLGQARQLTDVLPATLAAWEQGLLDGVKVRAICDTVLVLPAETAAAVQDLVLPKAPGQTVAQLRAALRRAVIKADPAGAAERHRLARKGRRVVLGDEREGMASL